MASPPTPSPINAPVDSGLSLKDVLAALPDLWFVLDAQGRYLSCGDDRHPWLVRPFHEVFGKPFETTLPSAVGQRGRGAIERARATGQVQRFEYELGTLDGQTRHFEGRVAPMADGRFLYLARDLTELRRLQQDLTLMQRAVEADAAMPVAVADARLPDHPLVYVNKAFERLSGYSRDEALGRNCRFMQGDAPVDAERRLMRHALTHEQPCTVTLPNRRRDGSLFLNELHLVPMHDSAGQLTHYMGLQHDVTERARAAEQLRHSEQRWKFALEGAGDGVWDHDEDTGTVYYSSSWKRMLGLSDDEVGDTLREWTHRIHPDDKPGVLAAIARYRGGQTDSYSTEHRLRHKEGHWIWVLDRGKIVERRPDGSPRRVVGTHSDITRARANEEAVRERQAAEMASRSKSEFLSRMSHEMRTPLNAILGFTQLLQQSNMPRPDYIAQIAQAGRHMLGLINDVLDLQQVEAGRLSLRPEALHLPTLIDSCMTLLQPLAEEQAVSQERDAAEDLWVMADDRRLRQVLLNIGSNAIKYNRRAGRVRWAATPADATANATENTTPGARQVCLSVQDDGPGLSEDQQRRLFQPFERLGHETSSVVGSGLGLLIAQRMVQEMGGDLTLSSTPGQGTRVAVLLPVGTPAAGLDAVAGSSPAPAPAPASATAASVPLRVLYVEDNPVNALILQEAVAGRSHIDLRVAPDGPQALEMARLCTPHVLVLDAHLPGMSGHEVLQHLRLLPGLAQAPAIMCSADAMNEDLARAQASGFMQYWTKPLELAQVLDDLDSLYQQCAATTPADTPSTPAPVSSRAAPQRS